MLISCVIWQQRQIKQAEENVPKVIERRSLLPRMIYLSIQCASSSVKENIETNGSAFNSKVPLELKILLERYAKFLGFSFQDAIEVLFSISSEKKSSEVSSHHQFGFVFVCERYDLAVILFFVFCFCAYLVINVFTCFFYGKKLLLVLIEVKSICH